MYIHNLINSQQTAKKLLCQTNDFQWRVGIIQTGTKEVLNPSNLLDLVELTPSPVVQWLTLPKAPLSIQRALPQGLIKDIYKVSGVPKPSKVASLQGFDVIELRKVWALWKGELDRSKAIIAEPVEIEDMGNSYCVWLAQKIDSRSQFGQIADTSHPLF